MKRLISILFIALVVTTVQISVQAQVNGSISGTVSDQNGAVVPGAAIKVAGQAGELYNVTTNENGYY